MQKSKKKKQSIYTDVMNFIGRVLYNSKVSGLNDYTKTVPERTRKLYIITTKYFVSEIAVYIV